VRPAGLALRPTILSLLALLVALFVGGMWLLSTLNLRFAESSLAELRDQQIAETFQANLQRIDHQHRRLEDNTRHLAQSGGQLSAAGVGDGVLEGALEAGLEDFPDADGVALWLSERDPPLGLEARRGDQGLSVARAPGDWEDRDWFRTRMAAWRDSPDVELHWSPAYYDRRLDTVVVSLAMPVRDDDGGLIGMAATHWGADEIIGLVDRVEVTPSSFAFLLDPENRNLSSLARADDPARSQSLIDAVTDLRLHAQADLEAFPVSVMPMQAIELVVEDEAWALYHATTRAGMVFGMGVPRAEIDAVLAPMRESNLRLVLVLGVALLLLAGGILYLVAGILRQLRNLYTDELTGLPNRARLIGDLPRAPSATLALVNLDRFRELNDFFGHACGDAVILHLATSLERRLAEDPAWRTARLYRMPGDEMAILMQEHPDRETLGRTLASLQQGVTATPFVWQGQELSLQVTLGAAQSEPGPADAQALMASANIALKLARHEGRGWLIYDPAHRMREAYEHNLVWANRIKQALAEGRLVPFFQPILEVRTGRIDKFECLVRLIDEQGEPVSPGQFLPVAKKIRLYREITRTMVAQSFARFEGTDHSFSLNLSCEDLVDPELTADILDRLAGSRIAERVIFEILESEGIENYAPVREFIDRAKALGSRIAIDDFGTGYSNFEHLLRLDVDLIKIDGSLIRHLDEDAEALTLTRGIVRFAHDLGIETVAEFVHDAAVMAWVRELGIDFAQGAWVGMPSASLVTEVEPI
jgi:c-di-GMP phosphodiesterase